MYLHDFLYYVCKNYIMESYDMIKLNVLKLLEEQGRTKYWLWKQLNMSYQNFNKMVNNETKSIRYDNIESICFLLNCTPDGLFEIDFSKKEE